MHIETISTPATVALRSLILVLVADRTHLPVGDGVCLRVRIESHRQRSLQELPHVRQRIGEFESLSPSQLFHISAGYRSRATCRLRVGSNPRLSRRQARPLHLVLRSVTPDDHEHVLELSCEEFERLGHEVRVELKHRAVSGIRIDDEVAIRKTPRQIVRVRARDHAITIAVGDKHRLVNL